MHSQNPATPRPMLLAALPILLAAAWAPGAQAQERELFSAGEVHVSEPLPKGYRIIEGDIQIREEEYQAILRGREGHLRTESLAQRGRALPLRQQHERGRTERTQSMPCRTGRR